MKARGGSLSDYPPLVFMIEKGSSDYKAAIEQGSLLDNTPTLKEYLMDNFTPEARADMKNPRFFYTITFEKPGGLVMPIIVKYTYSDGTSKTETYPAQIWRFNDLEVRKAIASEKEIVNITIDPNKETADVDSSNNMWPKEIKATDFDRFKSGVKN
jgi:hypothetical protein